MRIIIFSCLIISVLIVSCTQKNKSNNETKTLKEIDSLTLFLGLPTSMKLFGNKLIIIDMFDKQEMVKVIDTNTKKLCYKFAEKGQGPYEYLHIGNIDGYSDPEDRLKINIYDPINKKLAIYDYDSLVVFKKKYEPAIRNFLNNTDVNFHELIKIKDGYLATGMTEDFKYTLFSDSLEVVDHFGLYRPKPSKSFPNISHVIANHGNSTVSNNKELLIEIIYNASVLSCYDLNHKTKIWEYNIHDLDYKMEGKSIINNAPMGYLSASITDKYIYALYSGEKEDLDALATYGKELHIFNYKGDIIDKCYLSQYAFSICADPKTKKLYVLSHEPEPKIFIYELPQI